jgi:hypothetical protein
MKNTFIFVLLIITISIILKLILDDAIEDEFIVRL